eukprot:8710013-Karenia_brevis.AAC.1
MLEYFGFGGNTKAGGINGYREDRIDEDGDEALGRAETKEFRGLAARGNFMSLDCPDLQFPIKQSSRNMANPNK